MLNTIEFINYGAIFFSIKTELTSVKKKEKTSRSKHFKAIDAEYNVRILKPMTGYDL